MAVVLLSTTAQGIVVHDNPGESSNPASYMADPATGVPWSNVGWLSFGTDGSAPGTGVYVGDGWFLTANHNPNVTGITLFTDDPSGGTTYALHPTIASVRLSNPAPGTGMADLRLYKLATTPNLPALTISSASPSDEQGVILIGTGRERGSALKNITVQGGTVQGYDWAATRNKTWAANTVHGVTNFDTDVNTFVYHTDFSALGSGQATDKDSGGGVFIYDAVQQRWELSGIILGIATYEGQPAGTSAGGNLTYIADLSYYADQISTVVPEPSALALVAVAGALMIRRRHAA